MRVALIGLGEVGRVLAEDFGNDHELIAWDTAFADPDSKASRNAVATGIETAGSSTESVMGVDVVIAAVTAANTEAAAAAVADAIAPSAYYLDLNSASPGQKTRAAALIDGAGGAYVEAAVMSPINPLRLGAPILLGGAHANAFVSVAADVGFSGCEVYSDELGKASATKLCRSVLVKGMEALVAESMMAARYYGVEDRVLASMSNMIPAADWEELAGYLISRALQHGTRRAEEMREAAITVTESGLEPLMASATAARQDWAAQFPDAINASDLAAMLDAIRRDMNNGRAHS